MVISKFGATFQQLVNLLRTQTAVPLVRILKALRDSLTSDEKLKYFGPEKSDIVDLTSDEDPIDIK